MESSTCAFAIGSFGKGTIKIDIFFFNKSLFFVFFFDFFFFTLNLSKEQIYTYKQSSDPLY